MDSKEFLPRTIDLQLKDDMQYHRRAWLIQSIARAAAAVLLLAALIGLWGQGPLSRSSKGEPTDLLRLEYERFGQFRNDTTLKLKVDDSVRADNKIQFWLSRDYLERYQVQEISPQPEQVALDNGHLVYTLSVAQPSDSYDIVFRLVPTRFGVSRGDAGTEGGKVLSFTQLIYP